VAAAAAAALWPTQSHKKVRQQGQLAQSWLNPNLI